ncbi:hypothetical protein HXZ94_05665 [Empedobacter falsenii]|uniref:hypothetical protein n=1 Tax=Empedobacter falsenii TaxID=343874 RepID=UPI0025754AEF|nr:hypothetical protein [Empedobacter falsenii]MDM1297983.1 hypothetical protein [Empedobacter falsenii]MDM1317942.1 hypothetical protein [Empedobacter falsenii]
MSLDNHLKILNEIIIIIKDEANQSKIEFDILENIYNLGHNLNKIESNLNNIQTIVSLARTIMDYYSVYHLLFIEGDDIEKSIRQNLYLCDGYNSFLKTVEIFNEIDSDKSLSDSIHISLKSISNIENSIHENWEKYCTLKHIKKYSWKFNSNTRYTNYSWKELYEKSIESKITSKLISEYFSMYIHGLAIQSIKKENKYFLNATLSVVENTLFLLNINLMKIHYT